MFALKVKTVQLALTVFVVFGRPFVKRFALCYRTFVCLSSVLSVCLACPLCDVGVLWPNGSMDQDKTCQGGGGPRPWPYRIRWLSSSPCRKGAQLSPIFGPYLLWPNGWAGWIKMSLGRDIGLGSSDIALNGDPDPPLQKGNRGPNFRPMSIVAKRLDGSNATWYGGRPRPRPHCVRWVPSSP